MGKKQKKNIFKVANTKSLKSKSKFKPKPVTTQLKNLKVGNKNKIVEVDQQLVSLQNEVRNIGDKNKKTEKPEAPKKNVFQPKDDVRQQFNETTNVLSSMQLQ